MSISEDPGLGGALDGPPLGFLVASVGQQAMSCFRVRLEPHGLHPRAFAVLWALTRTDRQSQQDLSRNLGFPASRLVGILDHLEEQGLVEREAHPTDRRTHLVALTTSGRRQAETLLEEATRLDRQLAQGLPDDEQAQLRRTLLRIAANLDPRRQPDALRIW